jgi:hypothetical protein
MSIIWDYIIMPVLLVTGGIIWIAISSVLLQATWSIIKRSDIYYALSKLWRK